MDYKVKVKLDDTFKASISPQAQYKIKTNLTVNVVSQKLKDLTDVVTTNLNTNTNNYVLTYDATTNNYVFVDPDAVLLAAASLPTTQVNVSGIPTSFANVVLDSSTDPVDGGNF